MTNWQVTKCGPEPSNAMTAILRTAPMTLIVSSKWLVFLDMDLILEFKNSNGCKFKKSTDYTKFSEVVNVFVEYKMPIFMTVQNNLYSQLESFYSS